MAELGTVILDLIIKLDEGNFDVRRSWLDFLSKRNLFIPPLSDKVLKSAFVGYWGCLGMIPRPVLQLYRYICVLQYNFFVARFLSLI